MKKVLICVLIVITLLSFSAVAFAGERFENEETGISFDISEDFIAIDRSTKITQEIADSLFTDIASIEAMQSNFAANDIYLDLLKSDLSCEIVYIAVDNAFDKNLNLLNYSDSELEEFSNAAFADTVAYGASFTPTMPVKLSNANWITAEGEVVLEDGSVTRIFNISTVYNGIYHSFQLQNVLGTFTQADK